MNLYKFLESMIQHTNIWHGTTTEKTIFAECQRLCRVYFIGHSAKTVFAECQIKYTRQKKNTRQNASLPSAFFLALSKYVFCRVLFFSTRQNASLPSAFFLALGKDVFCRVLRLCRVPFSGTRQRCILPSAIFRHTAKCVFAECLFLALGKDVFCQVLFFGTRQISFSKQFLRP